MPRFTLTRIHKAMVAPPRRKRVALPTSPDTRERSPRIRGCMSEPDAETPVMSQASPRQDFAHRDRLER